MVDRLRGLDIPTGGPDLRRRAFSGLWEREAWIQELAELCQGDGGPDEDDVGLMMSYVSGMAPPMRLYDPDIGSETFSEWIDHLEDLPPDAHEWAEIELFIETVTERASAKRAERVTVQLEAAGHAFAAILREFDSELRYLGMDETVAAWEAEVSERLALVNAAMDVVSELRETWRSTVPFIPRQTLGTGRRCGPSREGSVNGHIGSGRQVGLYEGTVRRHGGAHSTGGYHPVPVVVGYIGHHQRTRSS